MVLMQTSLQQLAGAMSASKARHSPAQRNYNAKTTHLSSRNSVFSAPRIYAAAYWSDLRLEARGSHTPAQQNYDDKATHLGVFPLVLSAQSSAFLAPEPELQLTGAITALHA